MTNVDELTMQMEFSRESRRKLALELLKLRNLERVCRRHRVPHQVQTALRVDVKEYELDPTDPPGTSVGLPLKAAA